MLFIKRMLVSITLLGVLQHSALAAEGKSIAQISDYAFGAAPVEQLVQLDQAVMEDTQGQIWALPLAIASLDFAVMGFFWGIYLPAVAPLPGEYYLEPVD